MVIAASNCSLFCPDDLYRSQIPIKTAAANRLLQGFHKRRDLEAVFKVGHRARMRTATVLFLCFEVQALHVDGFVPK